MPLAAIDLWDGLIVLAYACVVVALGVASKRKQKTAADYMLGGKQLPWWAIGVSLIATSFSSISLLGGTDSGFSTSYAWWQLQLGDLLAIGVVCVVFLPFFARLSFTTAYEYLEVRFGKVARRLASVLFHVTVLLRAGPILATTAAVGAHVIGLDGHIELAIIGVGIAAMAYSAVGGLGAVVWTDTLQMVLVVGGVIACLALAMGDLPKGEIGFDDALNGKDRPPVFDVSPDPARVPTVLTSVLAYGILAMSVFGTNQQSVQRFLACKDVRAARRAGVLAWAIGAVVVALTMTLGIALYAWYDGAAPKGDIPVLGTFIADRVPIGLTGVLVAAILAAAMSSMDSAIHSMSTATLVDFVEPLRRAPLDEAGRLATARRLTLIYGVLAIAAALIAHQQLAGSADKQTNVLTLVVRWLGYAAGPILALFLLAIGTRRVGERAAVIGVLAGYLFAFLANDPFGWMGAETPLARLGFHPLWTAAFSCVVALGVALLLSLKSPSSGPTGGASA
ncbi:MAG: sodium/solute symporter [Planctomycetota bacterium]|nr:sodium/solute symporter [Planctomycetota bacterium]